MNTAHDKLEKHFSKRTYRESLGLTQQRLINYWPDEEDDPIAAEDHYLREVFRYATPTASDNILDVGSGPGGTAIWLANKFDCQVFGVDINSYFVSHSQEMIAQENLSDKIKIKKHNLVTDDLPGQMFDKIVSLDTITYIEPKLELYKKMKGLLKPGGKIVVADYFIGRNGSWLTKKMLGITYGAKHFVTFNDYQNILSKAGLQVDNVRDVTRNTAIATVQWMEHKPSLKATIFGRFTGRRLFYELLKWFFVRACVRGDFKIQFLTISKV